MTGDQPLTLAAGSARCIAYPQFGGSLGAWTVAGQNMLRGAQITEDATFDPLRMSSFPLVPYSNRIGNAQYNWDGATINLTRNFAPEPHAIHGVGWTRHWDITCQQANSVTLSYAHIADDSWPWDFLAEQTFDLTNEALTLKLRARNDHSSAVPLAFGHHPYFDAAGATLRFSADTVWMSGMDALPTTHVPASGDYDFAAGVKVADRVLDHCFTGWNGTARIDWADRAYALELTATPTLGVAVVYIPKAGDAFCFEPVPHINNALNRRDQTPSMPIIAPGAWFGAEIVMRAVTA